LRAQADVPRVVCAPDKLRGALSAAEAAAAMASGVRAAGCEPLELPVADGGEGTLDALAAVGVARPVRVSARDAFGRETSARVGDLGDGTWLVEVAQAIDLQRVVERDPRRAGSAGVGDLLLAVRARGARRVLVALGGSATVDGGIGLLHALGGARGADGEALLAGERPDVAAAARQLDGIAIEVLHDVDVPLCGPHGAARLFGAQKGMAAQDAPRFDAALQRWGEALGDGIATMPGAGAAGGLGAALYALGAEPCPGAARVLALVGIEDALAGAALCVTAEGSVDDSTLRGKAVAAVLSAAHAAGVGTVVLGGRVTPEAARELRARGACEVRALGPAQRPLEQALAAAGRDLSRATAQAVARCCATAGPAPRDRAQPGV
jgi:glycerate kinase